MAANRKVVIEEVLSERENYSKVILHKPMMLPKKDQKSEKEIDIRENSSRYVRKLENRCSVSSATKNPISKIRNDRTGLQQSISIQDRG